MKVGELVASLPNVNLSWRQHMSESITLTATIRTDVGKGASRRLRRLKTKYLPLFMAAIQRHKSLPFPVTKS